MMGGGLVDLTITALYIRCQCNRDPGSSEILRRTNSAGRNHKMPRKPDPELEHRILNAAHTLWKRGGEKALTLRAVARVAGTNTPAVYRRFKDRKDLLLALLRHYQNELGDQFRNTHSIEDTAEVYIDYLVQHPHAYELLLTHG